MSGISIDTCWNKLTYSMFGALLKLKKSSL